MQNTKQDAETRAQQDAERGAQDPRTTGAVIEHFIDGKRHGGSGRTADVYNPATGQVAKQVLLASAEEVATAVEAAELALQDRARGFDLTREDPRLRDRYGRNEYGQSFLLARRLVESGVGRRRFECQEVVCFRVRPLAERGVRRRKSGSVGGVRGLEDEVREAGENPLVHHLARDPSRGAIEVAGRDLSEITDKKVPYYRRNIGIVFQDFKLLPNRTVHDNVAYALQVTGGKRREIAPEWDRSADTIVLSDDGRKIYNYLRSLGIKNVVMMGVHTNMCVLGRSFGIRQLFVTTLEFCFDFGLGSFGGLGITQDALCADKTNFGLGLNNRSSGHGADTQRGSQNERFIATRQAAGDVCKF